ncbi:hypothetical protein P4S72_21190 [Vibrio sp. PP-XX7]
MLGAGPYKLGIRIGPAAFAQSIGAYAGAHSAIRFGSPFIRPVFVVVVSILATRLAYHAWFSTA